MHRSIPRLMLILTLVTLALPISGCMIHRNAEGMHTAYAMDRDSKAYFEQVIPPILQHWDTDRLLKESSPQLLNHAPASKVRKYVAGVAKVLGPLKQLEAPIGQANIEDADHHTYTTAAYKAQAGFTNGDGVVNVRLIKQDGHWQILFFAVESDSLPTQH